MGSVHKAHLLRAEPGRVVPRTHMQLFGSWPHCFMGNRLEGMTGRQTTVYLDLDTGGCFWKWPKWGCRFKENNWWYLLPMTKFSKQTWEKNENFWKLAYPFPHDLDSFWEVKDFSDEIGGDINKCDFQYCPVKCIIILKIWDHLSFNDQRMMLHNLSKCKIDQWSYRKFTNMVLDSTWKLSSRNLHFKFLV